MRGLYLIFCALLAVGTCVAQDISISDNTLTFNYFDKSFSDFLGSVKSRNSSDKKLVKRLFVKAHADYLKNYKAYSQLDDVFEKGNFDCLSGTYFLAASLDTLGLNYKIFETNYHVFLMVETRRGEILVESTDRDNGLVMDKMMIKEKLAGYQEIRTSQSGEMYLSKLRMFREILPSQLPGLLYFNRAVETFNKNRFTESCLYLEQAWKIYDNPRIEAFAPILMRSIEASELDNQTKEKLSSVLRSHLSSSAYASR